MWITFRIIGCVQAITSCLHETRLTAESSSSAGLTKTLRIIYSRQKGSRHTIKCLHKVQINLNAIQTYIILNNFKKGCQNGNTNSL